MPGAPSSRVRQINDEPIRKSRGYVLYWMTAFRRLRHNFALQHAAERARKLDRPLVILEPLRCGYRWASDRLHRFVLDGMAASRDRLADSPALYYPYVEPEAGAGKGLLAALARDACLVVADDFPGFFLPHLIQAGSRAVGVRMEAVDANGLLPLSATERAFPTAHSFRRFLQRELPKHLREMPELSPLGRGGIPTLADLPGKILRRWPMASPELLDGDAGALGALPIDHDVAPVEHVGGEPEARAVLRRFLTKRLGGYAERRNQLDEPSGSGLSPYLHFGQISAHEVFRAVMRREKWSPERLSESTRGDREGWWGASPAAEAFLDQLVTWRELGTVFARHRPDHDRYESLPPWARKTLDEHAADRREHVYSLAELEAARTHRPLWNAAQTQLVREGTIDNYMRMVWGKKILEWTESPQKALSVMIHLNNKHALDGRDPNSYSGIFWVLGRFDRAWGPERPIYGAIRYMSLDNTARKMRTAEYRARYATTGVGA